MSTVVYLDSGVGVSGSRGLSWAMKVGATPPVTIYRLLCRGTVEDSVMRRQTQRRLLQDMGEASEGEAIFRKQTIEELFNPQLNDNGLCWEVFEKEQQKKKKDKVSEDLV